MATQAAFRALDDAGKLPDNYALGSGYDRLKPHKPVVPKGAPAELRLDARKEEVIPLYPY